MPYPIPLDFADPAWTHFDWQEQPEARLRTEALIRKFAAAEANTMIRLGQATREAERAGLNQVRARARHCFWNMPNIPVIGLEMAEIAIETLLRDAAVEMGDARDQGRARPQEPDVWDHASQGARDALLALTVLDVFPVADFRTLTKPWRSSIGQLSD